MCVCYSLCVMCVVCVMCVGEELEEEILQFGGLQALIL